MQQEWEISTTGGEKISSERAAQILKMSRANLYNVMERGVLKRAEKPKRGMKRTVLVFYLTDVVSLALEYNIITQEEANKLLHPNPAAAIVAA